MAEKINDGGPACSACGDPATTKQGHQHLCDKHYRFGQMRAKAEIPSAEKIDMRDYFAAKAMQSYLLDKDRDSFTFEQWANAAYGMADAMLKARGQQ